MTLTCRPGCAACCTAPSISSPIPGMPQGKPAGVPCVQLDDQLRCKIFGQPERPAVCTSLRPEPDMCGTTRTHALRYLHALFAQGDTTVVGHILESRLQACWRGRIR